MFDISLGELAVIGTVALVVIGPEKLPKVARTIGLLVGRAQRMAAGFRADLERELQASEMAELQKKMTEEAASFRDEMAESAAGAAAELSILPPPELAEPAPAKPRRTRKKTDEPPLVEAPAAEVLPEPAPVKKPRKRKTAIEPVADLFAEAEPAPAPDAKDRR